MTDGQVFRGMVKNGGTFTSYQPLPCTFDFCPFPFPCSCFLGPRLGAGCLLLLLSLSAEGAFVVDFGVSVVVVVVTGDAVVDFAVGGAVGVVAFAVGVNLVLPPLSAILTVGSST